MRTIVFISLLLFACQPSPKAQEEKTVDPFAPPSSEGNWIPLFDGVSLEGWRAFKNKPNNSWEVVDSMIHCKAGDAADQRGDLVTSQEYENFEFVTDWMIEEGGNSGIIYRASEEFDQSYLSGPEYQLLDDKNYPDPNPTASNYDMNMPVNALIKPAGQWNNSRIIVNGDHVEHWLNGVKVVDYTLHSEDWLASKAKSKWKDVAGYGMAKKGHICLQDHGHQVWFKSIWIKKL